MELYEMLSYLGMYFLISMIFSQLGAIILTVTYPRSDFQNSLIGTSFETIGFFF